MFRAALLSGFHSLSIQEIWLTVIMLCTNLVSGILANASFKVSAISPTWRGFMSWQVVGNLAGLG